MHNNLEAEIVRKRIDRRDIAKAIGRTYNTLNLKIAGKYPFTYDEAVIIHEKFFAEYDMKELFRMTENKKIS